MEENNQNIFPQKEAESSASAPTPVPAPPVVVEIVVPEKEIGEFSLKKWGLAGILIAVLNPVFAGLIFGALLLTEPKLKKLGAVVTVISIAWGVVSYFLIQKYWSVSANF